MNRRIPLLLSGAAILFMLAVSIWAATQIPSGARVPIHFDAAGNPNGWADREVAIRVLFLLPGIALLVAILLAIIPSIDPRGGNLLQSARAYTAIWVAVMALLAAIHYLVVRAMLGGSRGDRVSSVWVLAAIGLALAVLGNYLPKLRSNWFAGIRTPWTLSSELSWSKTHRLGGRLMMLLGALIFVASLLRARWPWIFIAVLVVGPSAYLVFVVAYSYHVWKEDPERQRRET